MFYLFQLFYIIWIECRKRCVLLHCCSHPYSSKHQFEVIFWARLPYPGKGRSLLLTQDVVLVFEISFLRLRTLEKVEMTFSVLPHFFLRPMHSDSVSSFQFYPTSVTSVTNFLRSFEWLICPPEWRLFLNNYLSLLRHCCC